MENLILLLKVIPSVINYLIFFFAESHQGEELLHAVDGLHLLSANGRQTVALPSAAVDTMEDMLLSSSSCIPTVDLCGRSRPIVQIHAVLLLVVTLVVC